MLNKKNFFATALAGVTLTLGLTGVATPSVAAPAPVGTADTAGAVKAPTLAPPKTTKADKPTQGKAGRKGKPGVAGSGSVSTLSTCSSPCYFYAGGIRNPGGGATVDGVTAQVRVAKPAMDSVDSHTLAEISVQKDIGGQQQIIEVGWTIDRLINGDSNPHLFVFRWVNGVAGTYNGSGWVDYAPNPVNAGANLTADIGALKQMLVLHYNSEWWIAYDNNWIGYFPDSIWTNAGVSGFTNSTYQQLFGEIAAWHDPSCTDMGNGNFPTIAGVYPVGGTEMLNLNTYIGLTPSWGAYTGIYSTRPTAWKARQTNSYSLRYGGPGDTVCP